MRPKANSITQKLRLIYYTFFYNEHNDSLSFVETFLYPFVEYVSKFFRIIGWVSRLFFIDKIKKYFFCVHQVFSVSSNFTHYEHDIFVLQNNFATDLHNFMVKFPPSFYFWQLASN